MFNTFVHFCLSFHSWS